MRVLSRPVVRRRSRKRAAAFASGTVLAAAVAALVLSAVESQGFPVQHASLNDGGIWVTSDSYGLFGRLNKPAGALDAAINPPGGAQAAYELDVLQQDSAVLAWDRSAGKLYPVDPDQGVTLTDQAVPVPATDEADAAGSSVAVLDPTTGEVRAERVDAASGVTGLAALETSSPPLAKVGADRSGSGSGSTDGALAVGQDGSVYAVAADGTVATLTPLGAAGFAPVQYSKLGHAVGKPEATTVGSRLVVLDAANGRLLIPGGPTVTVPGVDAHAVLQQPGPAADSVLLATSHSLLAVDVTTGSISTLSQAGGGAPAAPVRLGSCVYAAWAATQDGYVSSCNGQPATHGGLTDLQELQQPRFRINHHEIVLNDLANGAVWDLSNGHQDGDWTSVLPPPTAKPGQNSQAQQTAQQLAAQPPKAVNDTLGARPGRTTVLHVLDVDSDPSGATLAIASVTDPDYAGARLQIAPDGQTIEITLPADTPAAPIHFRYTVNDGKGLTSTATVTVQVRTPADNEPPALRPGFQSRTWTVPSGGHLQIPVLTDWRDFDGDPLVLASASAGAASGAGSAATTSDGSVDFTAPVAAGPQTIHYQVSDGIAAPVDGTLSVVVQSPSATATVAPVAEPDVARGEVGQPVVIHPLDNDLPGADPRDAGASLGLAGPVNSPAGANVTTDLTDGSVTVTATRPGTFLLGYTVKFGDAPFANGTIRVDVTAVPGSPQPPVTVPVSAVVHGQQPVTVDVLAADFDPAGALLEVQHAAPVSARSGLQVAVVGGRWLRISAQSPTIEPNPQLVDYTVTDGVTAPVTGQVSVTQVAAPAVDTPIPVDDYATVRAGDRVSVAVLANDVDLAGAPLSLAADVPGAPAPGQFEVVSVAGTSGPRNGSAYITGDTVTYVAPAGISTPLTELVQYVAQNPSGGQAVGHLHVTVEPAPSAADPDHAPAPPPIEQRTIAGDTLTIPIATTGVDPDGDSVTLTGIASAPTLGRVLSMNAASLTYQAFPTSSGTDTFTYQVADRYGMVGQSTVSVAIVPPATPQPPVAVDEQVVAAPGAQVSVDVLSNALIAPDDAVTVEPLAPLNPDLPAGANVRLVSSTGPITLTAPPATGKPLVIAYGITDGIGAASVATVTVNSQTGYEDPPIARPAYADPGLGQTSVDVNVLKYVSVPDGTSGLTVTKVFDSAARVAGNVVTIPVGAHPQTVAYEVRDAAGASTVGLIYVAAPGSGAPYAKPGQITLARNGTMNVPISQYVADPAGKPVRLTTLNEIWGAPTSALRATSNGDSTLVLTAQAGYVGPAAVTFQVTDGATLTDPHGVYAVITVPVQIGPTTPVLRCPSDPVSVIEGGASVSLDVTSLCHVWVADPTTASSLRYSGQWQGRSGGVALSGTGTHTLTVTADSSAAPGAVSTLSIGVEGTSAAPSRLPVVVTAAEAPSVAPVTVNGVEAGQTATVDVAPYVTSQLRAPDVSVLAVQQTTGMAAAVSNSGATVRITPGAASHGTMTFSVRVSDVAQSSRTDRQAVGQITLNVLGVPGTPGTPVAGGTVLSGSVQLSWTQPPNNGAPIEAYEVDYNGGSQTCPASPCTITGLHNGDPYRFTVKAHNVVGWSQPSGQSASATPNTVPGAVVALAVSNPRDGALTLSWVAAPDQGSAVLDYTVTWTGGGSQTVTGTTTTATGLNNDTPYQFTVTAVNALGPGPAATVPGESAGAPAAPVAPTFSTNGSTDPNSRNVLISWLPGVDPNGPAPTTYTLTRTGAGTKIVCSNVTATNCNDDGLPNDGTIYTYTVTAANADAATDAVDHTSKPSPGTTMEATATPDSITGLTAMPTGVDQQATINFNAPASHGASSTITCTDNQGPCGTWTFPTTGQNNVTETVNGLPNGTNSTISLQDCNGSGGGKGAGNPCDSTVSTNVTTYGPINGLTVNASASGQTVNFSVSVNPNGKSATVHVDTNLQHQVFTTGVGAWSWSSSDNVGYSTTDTINVTVSDGTRSASQSASATTQAPPPPPPSVSVSRGTPCGGGGGAACKGGSCVDPTCGYIYVQTSNFSGNVTCTFNSQHGPVGFINEVYGPNQGKDSYNWYGYQHEWVSVTCSGNGQQATGQFTWP